MAGTPNSGAWDSAYARLARELRTAILQHNYPDGVRLPTEAELAETHGVSRQTVRRAFQDLVVEGIVYRVPGRGTFAASSEEQYLRQFGSINDLIGLSIDTSMELIVPLHREVDLDAAGRLQLRSDRVYKLVFRQLYQDTPFCLTTAYLPPTTGRLVETIPELTDTGARSKFTIIGLLDERLPAPIAEAEQSITVDLAPPDIARHLKCEQQHPLLRIDRMYYTTGGDPVELAVSHFLPEHYSYRVRLQRNVR